MFQYASSQHTSMIHVFVLVSSVVNIIYAVPQAKPTQKPRVVDDFINPWKLTMPPLPEGSFDSFDSAQHGYNKTESGEYRNKYGVNRYGVQREGVFKVGLNYWGDDEVMLMFPKYPPLRSFEKHYGRYGGLNARRFWAHWCIPEDKSANGINSQMNSGNVLGGRPPPYCQRDFEYKPGRYPKRYYQKGEHPRESKKVKRHVQNLQKVLRSDNIDMNVLQVDMGGRPPAGKTERKKKKTFEMNHDFEIRNKRGVTLDMKANAEREEKTKRFKRNVHNLQKALRPDNLDMKVLQVDMGGRPPDGKTERKKKKTFEMNNDFEIRNKRGVTLDMKANAEREEKIKRAKRELDPTGNEEPWMRKRKEPKKNAFIKWMGKMLPEHAAHFAKLHDKEVEELMKQNIHGMQKTYKDLFFEHHPEGHVEEANVAEHAAHIEGHASRYGKHEAQNEGPTVHKEGHEFQHEIHGPHNEIHDAHHEGYGLHREGQEAHNDVRKAHSEKNEGHLEEHALHLKKHAAAQEERTDHEKERAAQHEEVIAQQEEHYPEGHREHLERLQELLMKHKSRGLNSKERQELENMREAEYDHREKHDHAIKNKDVEEDAQTQPATQAQPQQQQNNAAYQQQLYQQQMYQQQQQNQQYNNYNNYGGGMQGMGGMGGMGMNGMGMAGMGMNGMGMNGMGMNGMGMNGMGMGQMGGVGAILNAIGNNLPKLTPQQQAAQAQQNQQGQQQNQQQNYPQYPQGGPQSGQAPNDQDQLAQNAAAAQEKAAQDREAQLQQPDPAQDSNNIQDQQDQDSNQDDDSTKSNASDEDTQAVQNSNDDVRGQADSNMQLPNMYNGNSQMDQAAAAQM